MNDDERRLHDWLDEELDRMAIGGDRPVDHRRVFASETDRALSETAADLRRLDAAQAPEPSAGFLDQLESNLMASNTAGRSWSGPLRAKHVDTSGATGQHFRPQRPFPGGRVFSNIAAFALVIALMAASAGTFYVMRDGDQPGTGAPRYAAISGTPEAVGGPDLSASFAEEPLANWEIPFPDGVTSARTGRLLVGNGLVYQQLFFDGDSESVYFNGIRAIDAVTGDIAWTHGGAWGRTFFANDETSVYSTMTANRVVALDALSGEERWGNEFAAPVVSAKLFDGIIYTLLTSHEMIALDADTGETVWTAGFESATEMSVSESGYPITMFSVVAGDEGVAAIAADGTLFVFDREAGSVLWSAPGFSVGRTQLAITDGYLLVITHDESPFFETEVRDGSAVGFELASGVELYRMTIAGWQGTIATPGGTGMFHFLANAVEVDGISTATGTPETDFGHDGSNELWTAPAEPGPWGNLGSGGADHVYGIDAATGQVTWQRSAVKSGFAGLFTSYASSERLWALTYDNQIVLLNGERGMILDAPVTLENAVKNLVPGSVEEGIAVEALGGALFGYGATSSDEQG